MMDFSFARPEIFLAFAGMVLLLLGAFGRGARVVSVLTLGVFAFAAFLVLRSPDGAAFGGMFVADAFARFVKLLLLGASAFALALSPGTSEKSRPEYPVLILFATLGMMLMVSAHDLMALYVGLEMQNLALYVLTSFHRERGRRASEAGVKYFMLGALSSGVLLFGLSLLYGFAGGTSYAVLAATLAGGGGALAPGAAVGLAFVVAGLAFKIAAAPFHMWSPDVYEGAEASVSVFLASVPKIAALAMLARLLAQPFGVVAEAWRPLVVVLAVLSMGLGAFAGLGQGNLKRLMAYSGIVNIGTLLIGLAAFRPEAGGTLGIEGMLLYLAVYVPGVLGAFGVMLALHKRGEPVETLSDLSGLSKTHPGLALAMGASLFSLTGIPPFAGFFGKYLVLLAAMKVRMMLLAVWGVLASVVAAGYYLRLIKIMYFDPPAAASLQEGGDRSSQFVVVLAALGVTLFVLIPAPLMEAARFAAESLFTP